MDTDGSVRVLRRYAPGVLNGLLALGATLSVVVLYRALGSIEGGGLGVALGILILAVAGGVFAVAFALLSLGYYLLARRRLDGPHPGLDAGTASAFTFLPAIALLPSSRGTGLLLGGLAMLGDVAGLVVAFLDR